MIPRFTAKESSYDNAGSYWRIHDQYLCRTVHGSDLDSRIAIRLAEVANQLHSIAAEAGLRITVEY